MRFSATKILNFTTVAGAAAMMLAGAFYSNDYTAGSDGIDMMTTASISSSVTAHSKAQPNALADQFTVFNHDDSRTCMMKLHRAVGYDVHRIEPSANCSIINNEFASARAWQENGAGTVTVTDRAGNQLMKLARGDGFAWEVIEPSNMHVSLDAF